MSRVVSGAMVSHALPSAVVLEGCRAPTRTLWGFQVSTAASCLNATADGTAVGQCLPWGTLVITLLCYGLITLAFYQFQATKKRKLMCYGTGWKDQKRRVVQFLVLLADVSGINNFKALHMEFAQPWAPSIYRSPFWGPECLIPLQTSSAVPLETHSTPL